MAENNNFINVGGRLHSIATGNVLAGTDEIYDDGKGKKQSTINAETDAILTQHTSVIQGLNSQNYETYAATNQTTAVTDVLPATGSVNTIYRLGNWDGSQFDPSCYTEYSWNGTQYVPISTKTQIDEVFDISAYHVSEGILATYADLSAALDSNNGGGVPQSLQRGGMSIKFVCSSDNKYVQYRLMSNTFSTTESDWQGVDNEPTAGSDNLIKSGGVAEQISQLEQKVNTFKDAGYLYAGIAIPTTNPSTPNSKVFYIANGKGIYINFENLEVTEDEVVIFYYDTVWHKVLTGIASHKTLTSFKENLEEKIIKVGKKISGFSQKEVDEEGLYLCNEKGEVLLRLDILDTKNPIGDNLISCITKHIKKEIPSPCIEEGFYICNENGEAIAQYKNDEWQFIGIEKEVKINPCYSSLGLESGVVNADTLSNGELVLMDYPQYLKRNATVSFGAKISTFSQVKVGVKGGYFCLAQIDSTNISIIHNTGTIKTEAHGLNISGWIDVALKVEELNVEISVHSLDGYKKITATLPFRELYGRPTVEVDENTTLTDVSLRGYCDDFQKSIWFVGDSYTSCTEVRWTGQMLNFGINNWMLLGVAGGKSKDLYEDLLLALKYGTPTYLVWCMGMNDADTDSLNANYKKYFELVKEKCDELGVVMIPATVPCVKTSAHPEYARDNSYKNEYIKTSGMRYIDLAKAVGGDTFTDDAWYDGYLETISPWIHTTELGAKAQMAQIIRDFPEILRNK